MKFIQLLLQSREDEFDLTIRKTLKIHASTGAILMKGNPDEVMYDKYKKVWRYGVGKLLHLVKWSRTGYSQRCPLFFARSHFMAPKVVTHFYQQFIYQILYWNSWWNISVLNYVISKTNLRNGLRLFCKSTYSFVAIDFLVFFWKYRYPFLHLKRAHGVGSDNIALSK